MALKTVVVPPEADGMKVDLLLRRLFPDLPESVLRRLFASRDVKLDGVRVSRDSRVSGGQRLQAFLPDCRSSARLPSSPDLPSSESSRSPSDPSVSLRVVYEDEDVLLVNKPAGVSVEPDAPGALSLSDLCRLRAEAEAPGSFPPVPCHRLDNKTSGLCLFAKNEAARAALDEAFRNRTVEKYYTCLVRGVPKPAAAVCSAFLLKDAEKANVRILDRPVPGARPIVTGYETLESGPVSRLRVHLVTGRTHQIRAHLAALGHPILGDDLYGDRAFNRLRKARGLKLCATSLTIRTNGRLPALDGKTFEIVPPF